MGGTVLPVDYCTAIGEAAHNRDVQLHIDGARIWHAAAAQGLSLEEIGRPADSLSVSKQGARRSSWLTRRWKW